MTVDKKNAACKAAAKHSTNPVLATIEYAKLTERLDLIATQIGQESLQNEMLSILPLYRHPVNSKLIEHTIFFDLDHVMPSGKFHVQPSFIGALDKEGVSDDLLTTIKEYVRESELRIIELAKCKDELGELNSKLSGARRVYEDNRKKNRPDRRNALVVQELGLSTGFAPKRVDYKKVYLDYVKLVRKKGLSRDDAVETVRRKYDLASGNAAINCLNRYRKIILEKWKRSDPSFYPEIKKHLKGLVPSKTE